ncbi:hypothetical protein UCDDA912_g01550 [Diaporthe ampelina]|uniref:Uncharacterized protein n=1 Tax=Diaporthe ampelina TaxID=1214573 RepID=A0A0G2HTV5_9PEZI|nr:hypothetical protein UCDDA912_g01550 [Diaporthe ampelina]
MARIDDLPVELVDFIADHLRRVSDLAALARASHKFYNVVDTLLYTFAKDNLQKHMAWHPLRWAAENGQTGTLKKALAAGIDVNMAFVSTTFMAARDWESFQIRVEAVDGKGVWDPPRLEPNLEWEPHEDDTDEDDMPTSTSTVDRMRPGYTPPPRRYANMDDGDDGWDGVDDFDPGMDPFDDEAEADFMAHFTHPFTGDYWSDDEMDDEDDDDFDMGQVDLCKHILDRGFVEVDAVDHSGLTPFYHAYRSGQWSSTVAFLLERGADVNFLIRQPTRHHGAEGGELFTAIYEACVFGCYAEAIKLINLGADVNKGHYVLDVQHKWPLHAVCEPPKSFLEPRRNPAMRSASASAKNNEEQRVELIKLMLRSGADLEAKTRQYLESPLLFAATHCDVAVLQVLLAEGANVESQK